MFGRTIGQGDCESHAQAAVGHLVVDLDVGTDFWTTWRGSDLETTDQLPHRLGLGIAFEK